MENGDTVHELSSQFLMLMSEICGSLPPCHLTTYWHFAVFSTHVWIGGYSVALWLLIFVYPALYLQAQVSLAESSRKLDLLRKSLELRRQELPPDSPAAAQLKRELQNVQAASPVAVTYTSLQPFHGQGDSTKSAGLTPSSFTRCAAVTGKLEVR